MLEARVAPHPPRPSRPSPGEVSHMHGTYVSRRSPKSPGTGCRRARRKYGALCKKGLNAQFLCIYSGVSSGAFTCYEGCQGDGNDWVWGLGWADRGLIGSDWGSELARSKRASLSAVCPAQGSWRLPKYTPVKVPVGAHTFTRVLSHHCSHYVCSWCGSG